MSSGALLPPAPPAPRASCLRASLRCSSPRPGHGRVRTRGQRSAGAGANGAAWWWANDKCGGATCGSGGAGRSLETHEALLSNLEVLQLIREQETKRNQAAKARKSQPGGAALPPVRHPQNLLTIEFEVSRSEGGVTVRRAVRRLVDTHAVAPSPACPLRHPALRHAAHPKL